MVLQEIQEKLSNATSENVVLYFIVRVLKPDMKKSSKVLDKYDFVIYQVDIDNPIRDHLLELTFEQLDAHLSKKLSLEEYDVLGEDDGKVLTYSMVNKSQSFKRVVTEQLSGRVPILKDLIQVMDSGELWAYGVGIVETATPWILSFRKIKPAKVAFDEGEDPRKGKGTGIIKALFSTDSSKLSLLSGTTINLDKQLDCIYYNELFYIFSKREFETIVGLDEEYKKEAEDVVEGLKALNIIEGIDHVLSKLETTPALHKKLIKVREIGIIQKLTPKKINRLKSTQKRVKTNLRVDDDKIYIENDKQVDDFIKLFSDYFKKGMVSNRSYGTYSGTRIKKAK